MLYTRIPFICIVLYMMCACVYIYVIYINIIYIDIECLYCALTAYLIFIYDRLDQVRVCRPK